MRPFLKSHVLNIFSKYSGEIETKAPDFLYNVVPFDLFLKNYFKNAKILNEGEKHEIIDVSFNLLRNCHAMDSLITKTNWEKRLEFLLSKKFDLSRCKSKAEKCSMPVALFNKLANAYGEDKAFEYGSLMLQKTPTTIFVNPFKYKRDDYFERQKKNKFLIAKTEFSPMGMRFIDKINVYENKDYKYGLFDVIDEGAQIIMLKPEPKVGDVILDYQACFADKSIITAFLTKGTGKIHVFEKREKFLDSIKRKFKKYNISNASFHDKEEGLNSLKEGCDLVLLDVPNTGSGVLRKNPELKLKFSEETLNNLIKLQRKLFDEAQVYVKKGGRLAYITSSILQEENLQQIKYFCKKYKFQVEDNVQVQTFPIKDGMDGYYVCLLTRKA